MAKEYSKAGGGESESPPKKKTIAPEMSKEHSRAELPPPTEGKKKGKKDKRR